MQKNQKPPKEEIALVWFKRDLRLKDNLPLLFRDPSDPTPQVVLYVIETDYWKLPQASAHQLLFICQCLHELNNQLQNQGNNLHMMIRKNATEALVEILQTHTITEVISHQETGNAWTFQRDIAFGKILKSIPCPWYQLRQNPIGRGSKTQTEGLHTPKKGVLWDEFYQKLPTGLPNQWKNPQNPLPRDPIPSPQEIAQICGETPSETIQKGGESQAESLLESFLASRCLLHEGYRAGMGNPIPAEIVCSRLSPHITWGSISTKTILDRCDQMPNGPQNPHIKSLVTRLLWRDHFLQKFETLHWMESRCLNPRMEPVRVWDEDICTRWEAGLTGYPFIDACMRSLNARQWLHFRARAMLVSFAAFALNLDWRLFDPHLARNFLDFEPGIHYSQVQMQSGTTLSSPPRIYNPFKQSLEKDPQGVFTKFWVPELKDQNPQLFHTPEGLELLQQSARNYPAPIVNPHQLIAIMRANAPTKSGEPSGLLPAKKAQAQQRNQLELFPV